MWSLRILSGELAGKSFELKSGSNKIGRSTSNDLSITSNGISKQHAEIIVQPDKIMISDSGSTNGTFVDGVAIKSKVIMPGQKLAFHDVICEVVATQSIPKNNIAAIPTPHNPQHMEQAMLAYQGNVAQQPEYEQQDENAFNNQQVSARNSGPKGIGEHLEQYVDEIVMPGAYKLAEWLEFKYLVMLFCFVFVVLVTALSTIPLTSILKSRIEKTSQQNARTLAKILANKNRASILAGQISGVQVNHVTTEPGVNEAYVIDLEGRVIAPSSLARTVPSNPFITKARKVSEPMFQQINDNLIGASEPILGKTSQGTVRPLAYAIVMYDMSVNAIDDSLTLSLLIQTFFIALILGAIVFFFLYKIILHPIVHINEQVSRSLRDGHADLAMSYNFPELQELIQNLQSSMARSSGGNSFSEQGQYEHERGFEASGIVNLVGFPAIAINTQTLNVIAVNQHFQEQIGKSTAWQDLNLDDVLDQALKLNISDIVERCKQVPNQVAQDDLDIDNIKYEISGQAVYGSSDVNYVLVCFTPNEGGL